MDLYEFYSGRCFDAYNELGAHVVKENVDKSRRKAVTGVDFVTYAPNAESVTVTGELIHGERLPWRGVTMAAFSSVLCRGQRPDRCINIRYTREMDIVWITVIRMDSAWS